MPASVHWTDMNAFKISTVNQKNPSVLGNSWNLNPSVTEGIKHLVGLYES